MIPSTTPTFHKRLKKTEPKISSESFIKMTVVKVPLLKLKIRGNLQYFQLES